MSNDQLTINTLRELNSRLASEITELRKENADIKAENVKLKQALEEYAVLKIRFEELEKKNKTDIAKLTAENVELKERVTKLEQKQTRIIINERDTSSTKDIFQFRIINEFKGLLSIPLPNEGHSGKEKIITSDCLSEQENSLTISESLVESGKFAISLSQDIINDDLAEIFEFVEMIHKENISNEIRERNRKKKLQIQGSMQSTSSSSDIQNEQGLRHDLSIFIKENSNKFNDVFDIKIPEFSLEVIITRSSKITAQNIADLFIIAMKVRQKEILCWYCYYKAYEDRIEDIKYINKIDDQLARTLVYNEIKSLLPDITDVNLRQRTFKAKKIYTLLMRIGIEKIQAITCSAKLIPTDQAQNTEIKNPYNKRVEQGLRHDLSIFIKENSNKFNDVFDIKIPEFSLEVIITRSSKITAQNIADLFIIAMKVRQKEILCWYCYYKAYEDRIEDIKYINKIDDQLARTLVYNEIKSLLPDITDVNLRQRTFKAKKIYTLLMRIGIEKIQAITCSANYSSVKYQEKIGVTNCNAHVTEQSNLNDSEIVINKEPKKFYWKPSEFLGEKDKSLLETKTSTPSNLTHNRVDFRNKMAEQYPGLYWEGSDENDDYYGITNKSLCPLCKLEHYEENSIEGKYKSGSYFIKCEQREIKIKITV
ncbi:hypothetical protein Glove_120g238 [Diversispora epigaea]|uniref:Uncharacterized protein n=1 Tax=Diversispora epigaea TaxID=1348612 RepID=A0A397J903_9GLOM|nr:hypothetical protein Glove_120g238 [Diversispora epigaea]